MRWDRRIARIVAPCIQQASFSIPAQVTIGQKIGQAMRIVSRCLWDTTTDNFASEYFENESLYCVCQVYGLYFE